MLLKDTFGYTCEQAKRKYTSKMVNGKKKNVAVSTFMIGCLHKQFGNILDYLREKDDTPELGEECDDI